MKGLLLKDLYSIKSYFSVFLVLDIVFIAAFCLFEKSTFMLLYPCIFSSMIPVSLISYEEKEKWNVYVGTLPYSRAQLVSSKYILSSVIGTFTFLVALLFSVGAMICRSAWDASAIVGLATTLIPFALLPAALLLPFIYKLGVEKGRIAYYIMVGIFCAFIGATGAMNTAVLSAVETNCIGIILFVVSVLAFGLSWLLSIRFYQKREI